MSTNQVWLPVKCSSSGWWGMMGDKVVPAVPRLAMVLMYILGGRLVYGVHSAGV